MFNQWWNWNLVNDGIGILKVTELTRLTPQDSLILPCPLIIFFSPHLWEVIPKCFLLPVVWVLLFLSICHLFLFCPTPKRWNASGLNPELSSLSILHSYPIWYHHFLGDNSKYIPLIHIFNSVVYISNFDCPWAAQP